MKKCFLLFVFSAARALAVNHYVDNTAAGLNDGSSWANAWTSLSSVAAFPGETVYISGGSTGNTQTYNRTTYWVPSSGSNNANRVTYQIGQDSAHNGTAIFNATVGGQTFVTGMDYVNLIGDAGDGANHFKITNYTRVSDNLSNTRFAYWDASDTILEFLVATRGGSTTTGIEVDHSYIKVIDNGADWAIRLSVSGTAATDSSVHHNLIYIPYGSAGFGADGVSLNGNGFSLYNNTIVGYYSATYSHGQHQDGIQSNGGSYIAIYNNIFLNIANYAVFLETLANAYTDTAVYNNIAVLSDSTLRAGSPAGIVCGFNNTYSGTQPAAMARISFSNNIIVDYPSADPTCGISLTNEATGPTVSATWTSCTMQNNVFVNGPTVFKTTGATVTTSANISRTSGQAATDFVSYTANTGGLSNDLHLRVTATAFIGLGTDLSAQFTTDKDGVTRTLPWDVGPYKFLSAISGSTPRFPLFQRQPRR